MDFSTVYWANMMFLTTGSTDVTYSTACQTNVATRRSSTIARMTSSKISIVR